MENTNILKNYHKLTAVAGIVIIAFIFRLLPHPPNFAPIAALALFSAVNIDGVLAYIIPLLSMLLSDIVLGFHSTMIFVYSAFLLTGFLGRLLKKKNNAVKLLFVSLLSSVLFFIITNFGVWLTGSMYPKNFSGLMEAYFLGIPFFRNTMLGDMFYSFTFFYGYKLMMNLIDGLIYRYKIRLSSSVSTD